MIRKEVIGNATLYLGRYQCTEALDDMSETAYSHKIFALQEQNNRLRDALKAALDDLEIYGYGQEKGANKARAALKRDK